MDWLLELHHFVLAMATAFVKELLTIIPYVAI